MYDYQKEKPDLLNVEGIKMILAFKNAAAKIFKLSSIVTMEDLMRESRTSGSSWKMMACVDMLVELRELVEIPREECPAQYRLFRSGI